MVQLEKDITQKFNDIYCRIDNCSLISNKQYKALKAENDELKSKLEAYILQDSEREENIKECLNNSNIAPNPCITDILQMREDFENKIQELDTRIIECEQYSRRENLVISGIPESVSQDQLEQKVIEIIGLSGLRIVPDAITACHRMYNPPQSRYPAKVVVRFCNRKAVNFCMDHRDDLQQKAYNQLRLNLRFFSSLCAKNQESLRICKWLKQENRIHDHYIRNGFVKVVDEEHGRPWKASNPSMLRKKFEDIPVSI